jgi:hypothetical protein
MPIGAKISAKATPPPKVDEKEDGAEKAPMREFLGELGVIGDSIKTLASKYQKKLGIE